MEQIEKENILLNFLDNYYVPHEVFIENVGSVEKIKKDLEKLSTKEEIKDYVNTYV